LRTEADRGHIPRNLPGRDVRVLHLPDALEADVHRSFFQVHDVDTELVVEPHLLSHVRAGGAIDDDFLRSLARMHASAVAAF
jgi:hypothetical protein